MTLSATVLLLAFVVLAHADCPAEPLTAPTSPSKSRPKAIELEAAECERGVRLRWVARASRTDGGYVVYRRAPDAWLGAPIARLPANATD